MQRTARTLTRALTIAIAGLTMAAPGSHAAKLNGFGIEGTDGPDEIAVTSFAVSPHGDTTFTYTPGPGTTLTHSAAVCSGGGTPGAVITCTGSVHTSFPVIFDMGPGDDTVRLGAMDDRIWTLISGGDGDDVLQGGSARDEIDGGFGDDEIDGGAGVDRLWTEMPWDTIYPYRTSPRYTGMNIDLAAGVVRPTQGDERDSIVNIEEAVGTNDRDRFVGDEKDNTYIGMGSIATIDPGPGNDKSWNRGGSTMLDNSARPGPLTITIAKDPNGYDRSITTQSPGGTTETDRISNLSRVVGSAKGDTITASAAARVFGGPGNDVLEGSPEEDALYGNEGADVVRGGLGFDFLNGGDDETVPAAADDPYRRGDSGDDIIDANDGERDQLTCGGGIDEARYDGFDSMTEDCENRPKPPPPHVDPPYTPLVWTPPLYPPPFNGNGPKPNAKPPVLRLDRSQVARRRAGKVTVEGNVVGGTTGRALARAEVTVRRGSRTLRRTRTSAQGTFSARVRVTSSTRLTVTVTDPWSGTSAIAPVTVRVRR